MESIYGLLLVKCCNLFVTRQGVKRGYGHWQDDTEIFHEQDVWERDAGVRGLISLFGNRALCAR